MWLYIGRPNCPECERFVPVLRKVIKKNRQNVYYYNTADARKENEQEMIGILEKLEVEIVPTMIYLEKADIKEKVVGYQDETSLRKLFKNDNK